MANEEIDEFNEGIDKFVNLCLERLEYECNNANKRCIAHNVQRDAAHVRYAICPGSGCCPFCAMLGSRGFVYHSPDSCEGLHPHCTCVAVPGFDGKNSRVEGYDPGFFEIRWKTSRDSLTTNQNVLAGVVRAEPMTFDEADHERCNPHLNDGVRYWLNCQSSVVAYEARRRGFDVEALPFDKLGISGELAGHTELAWYKPGTVETPKSIINKEATTPKRYERFLEDSIKGGERYHLRFARYGETDGHIVAIERDMTGQLMIYDPQDGTIMRGKEISNYLRGFSYESGYLPGILRVDELDFNKEYAGAVVKGSL